MLKYRVTVADSDQEYAWQLVAYYPVWSFTNEEKLVGAGEEERDQYSYMPCLAVNVVDHFSTTLTHESFVGQTEFIGLLDYQHHQNRYRPTFVSLADFAQALLKIHQNDQIAPKLLNYDHPDSEGYYAVTILQGSGSLGVYRLYASALDALLGKHSYRYGQGDFTSPAERGYEEGELVRACYRAKNKNVFAYLAYQRLKQQHKNLQLQSTDTVSTVTSYKRLLQSCDMSQMVVDYGLESALAGVTALLYGTAKSLEYKDKVSLKAQGRMIKQSAWPIEFADYTHTPITDKAFYRLGQRVHMQSAESTGIVCIAYAMAKSQRCFYYLTQDQLDEIQAEGMRYRKQAQEFLTAQQQASAKQGQTSQLIGQAKNKFKEFLGQENINVIDVDDVDGHSVSLCEILLISKDPLLKKDPVTFVSTALLERLGAPKLSLGRVTELGVTVSIALGVVVKEAVTLGHINGQDYKALTDKLIEGYKRLKDRLDRVNVTKHAKIADRGPVFGGSIQNAQGKKAARGSLLNRAEALTSNSDNEGNLLNLSTDDVSGSFNLWGVKDNAHSEFRWYDIQGDASAQFMRYTTDAAARMNLDHNALLINSHAKAELDVFTGNCHLSTYFPNKQGLHVQFELVKEKFQPHPITGYDYEPAYILNCGRFFIKLESEFSAVVGATGSLYANAAVHFKRFRAKDNSSSMLAQMVPLTDKEHAEYQKSKNKVVPEKALKRIKTIKPSVKVDAGVKV
ncbi:hypothetical protein, partial [Piscirickettsia litoralis]|uniref:hypothetical protein n=1 Tax=Piscirickettsia litoralis TaxID=1891921 RepID=UPI0013013DC0